MRREEKLRESMLRYLEGSLPADEVEKLNQAVEYDWAARREMAELMLQETLLTRVGQESEFFELDAPAPARQTARFTTSRIMKILPRPASAEALPGRIPAPPGFRRAVAIAAVIFFAISVGLAVRAMQPSAPVIELDAVITTAPPPEEVTVPAMAPPPPRAVKPEVVTAPPPAAPKAMPKAATAGKPKPPEPVKPGSEPSNPLLPADGIMTLPVPELLPPLPPMPPPSPPPKPKKK